MTNAFLEIKGMACEACAHTIEKSLSRQTGIEEADVNFRNNKLSIIFDENKISLSKIDEIIVEAGFAPQKKSSKKILFFSIKMSANESYQDLIDWTLERNKSVIYFNINLQNNMGSIKYDSNKINVRDIEEAIHNAGFEILEVSIMDYIKQEEMLKELKLKKMFKKLFISMIRIEKMKED